MIWLIISYAIIGMVIAAYLTHEVNKDPYRVLNFGKLILVSLFWPLLVFVVVVAAILDR